MPFLDPEGFYDASQYQQAIAEIGDLQEDLRGTVSPQGSSAGSIEILVDPVSGQITANDTRTFGTLAFLNAAAHTASATTTVGAQTIDAAYTQANLQATINLLVATSNEQQTVINQLLAALQTATIQA